MESISIYIHWPYCISKCPYCDFNSFPIGKVDQKQWAKAYALEIEHYHSFLTNRKIGSIYFGGGTPSLMEPRVVHKVIDKISSLWRLEADLEITLEANPSSSETEKFKSFRKAGINRLSLGVQSLRDDALRFLGRMHDVEDAKRAMNIAAEIFPRFSFDLIYGRNNQTPEMWAKELEEALLFEPKHISLYQLTIEPGTRFELLAEEWPLIAPEEDVMAMCKISEELLGQKGLFRYEISNYSALGEESFHNLVYWKYNDYLGIGPGAHGRYVVEGIRYATENISEPNEWLCSVKERKHGIRTKEILDNETAVREAVMMGLRLMRGIDFEEWRKKFGVSLLDFLSKDKIQKLEKEDLICVDKNSLRATKKGLQKLDGILSYIL